MTSGLNVPPARTGRGSSPSPAAPAASPGRWHPAMGAGVRAFPGRARRPVGREAEAEDRTRWCAGRRPSPGQGSRRSGSTMPGTGGRARLGRGPAPRAGVDCLGARCGGGSSTAVRCLGRVALAGLHLGATLGAQAAAGRSDVEALVAWGPFGTGRAYVRHILGLPSPQRPPGRPRGHAGGHPRGGGRVNLHPLTVAELEGLDLRTLDRALALRVLLLSRDEGVDEVLAGAWKKRGAELTSDVGSGCETMQQPRKSVVPEKGRRPDRRLPRPRGGYGSVPRRSRPIPSSTSGAGSPDQAWSRRRSASGTGG